MFGQSATVVQTTYSRPSMSFDVNQIKSNQPKAKDYVCCQLICVRGTRRRDLMSADNPSACRLLPKGRGFDVDEDSRWASDPLHNNIRHQSINPVCNLFIFNTRKKNLQKYQGKLAMTVKERKKFNVSSFSSLPRRLSSLFMSLLFGTLTTVLDPSLLRLTRGELATAITNGDALSSSPDGSSEAFFPLRIFHF